LLFQSLKLLWIDVEHPYQLDIQAGQTILLEFCHQTNIKGAKIFAYVREKNLSNKVSEIMDMMQEYVKNNIQHRNCP